MHYKILKGTPLFDSLTDLRGRMDTAINQAQNLAKELGGKEVATSGNYLAGGIDAVEFDQKPEKWRVVGKGWQNLYYPKADKSNKEIHDKIAKLPRIEIDELNKIVGFHAPQTTTSSGGFHWIKSVGMKWHKDFILMETAEGTKYKPVPDVIEILGSEYEQLQKKIKS